MAQYINEIRPMVEEFHSEAEILRRFEMQLEKLKTEAIKCDDSFKIYLSWQDGISPQLTNKYSEKNMLELHNIREGYVRISGTTYTLFQSDQEVVRFHFCKHRIYTPIISEFSVHQCLSC